MLRAPTYIELHSFGNIIAFFIGAVVFLRKVKGDLFHQQLGYIFVFFIVLPQVFTFLSVGPDDNWTWLHLLSFYVLYWIYQGIHVCQVKGKGWLRQHVEYMGSAFISLIVASFGVMGRHLPIFTENGIHWLWCLAAGAAVTIPVFNYYLSKCNFKE